jgi:hypothetical protein
MAWRTRGSFVASIAVLAMTIVVGSSGAADYWTVNVLPLNQRGIPVPDVCLAYAYFDPTTNNNGSYTDCTRGNNVHMVAFGLQIKSVTATQVSLPSGCHGGLTGPVTITPSTGQLIIHLTCELLNNAPLAQDDYYRIAPGAKLAVNVLDNDRDADVEDRNRLTVMLDRQSCLGPCALAADGALTYQTPASVRGTVCLRYHAQDPEGGQSDLAHVYIGVGEEPNATCNATRIPGGAKVLRSVSFSAPFSSSGQKRTLAVKIVRGSSLANIVTSWDSDRSSFTYRSIQVSSGGHVSRPLPRTLRTSNSLSAQVRVPRGGGTLKLSLVATEVHGQTTTRTSVFEITTPR